MLDDLTLLPSTVGIFHYAILHISIRAHQVTKGKRPLFPVDGEQVKVEEFAKRFFERNGYAVFKGDDIHLFFSILSFNFKNAFFYDVFGNWAGHQNAKVILSKLESLVLECVDRSRVSQELIEQAELALAAYYSTYAEKREMYSAFAAEARKLVPETLYKILQLYRRQGYTTKGAPDLFIARDRDFAFVEVKSLNDSLSAAQYGFFEGYLNTVGNNIYVLRVLPHADSEGRSTHGR